MGIDSENNSFRNIPKA